MHPSKSQGLKTPESGPAIDDHAAMSAPVSPDPVSPDPVSPDPVSTYRLEPDPIITADRAVPELSGEDNAAASSADPAGRSGTSAGDQRFLRILLLVFLAVFSCEWLTVILQAPTPPALIRGDHFQQFFRVDINSATWIDWIQLEGIGPALAHRIEADRRVNGPFESVDDLTRVPGIGPMTLERLRPWLVLNSSADHDIESRGW